MAVVAAAAACVYVCVWGGGGLTRKLLSKIRWWCMQRGPIPDPPSFASLNASLDPQGAGWPAPALTCCSSLHQNEVTWLSCQMTLDQETPSSSP